MRDEPFEPMSGDDLERIEAVGGCEAEELLLLVRTALHYRQQAMDMRDALIAASGALASAGYTDEAVDAGMAAAAAGAAPPHGMTEEMQQKLLRWWNEGRADRSTCEDCGATLTSPPPGPPSHPDAIPLCGFCSSKRALSGQPVTKEARRRA